MIDPALLREDPDRVVANFAQRGLAVDFRKQVAEFADLDKQLRKLNKQEEDLRASRNQLSRQIGEMMHGSKQDTGQLQQHASKIGEQIENLHQDVVELKAAAQAICYHWPNLLHDEVPPGKSEQDNKVLRKEGKLPKYDFDARDHVELGKIHSLLDFDSAGVMAKARFVVIMDTFARLHRALGQFMLDMHVKQHGYHECNVPLLVNTKALTHTGQLPKFASDDEFFSAKSDDLHLIPTAEVSLVNIAAGRLFSEEELPLKLAAHSLCFRREAGSYGKDTRGMLRQHQFEKVELVQIVHPDHSYSAWEKLIADAERILQKLRLPYQVVELCAADVGHAAARTVDLEVWLPGQNSYREISSCSNDTDYQARRMKTSLRSKPKNRLVHTLNGSGVAVGRALIAVLENYQDAQGNIAIPEVLQPYMDGLTRIEIP